MFIITVTYRRPLEEIEQHLDAHIAFLDVHYKKGVFVCSGYQVPRTGGIIIARGDNKAEIEELVTHDPFYEYKLATYSIIEFVASKCTAPFDGCAA